MEKNLKFYATEWQKGNHSVLNELIGNTVQVVQQRGKSINVERLRFNDKALNSIYWKLNWKYYSLQSSDFDSYVSNAFLSVTNEGKVKSIFDNVDLSRSPQEIVKFVGEKLNGAIYNQGLADGKIKKEEEENKKGFTIEYDTYAFVGNDDASWFSDDEQSDEILRKSDKVLVDDYISIEDETEPYQEFKDYVGGDVRNLLSESQAELFELMQDVSLTQQDMADQLGKTQQAISDMKKAIEKRINKKHFEFMTLKRVASNRNTYKTIKGFLQQHQTIITYDTEDSFNYFGYFIQFLESNHIEGEQEINSQLLQKNKTDYTYSVIDAVVDYINADTFKIVEEYIFNRDSNLKLTQRKKDSFVMNILKGFDKYIKDVEKAVQGLSDKVAKEGESQKYIDLLI